MKNNGEKKKLAKQSEDFRKVQFGENFKCYPEDNLGPLEITQKDSVASCILALHTMLLTQMVPKHIPMWFPFSVFVTEADSH